MEANEGTMKSVNKEVLSSSEAVMRSLSLDMDLVKFEFNIKSMIISF